MFVPTFLSTSANIINFSDFQNLDLVIKKWQQLLVIVNITELDNNLEKWK